MNERLAHRPEKPQHPAEHQPSLERYRPSQEELAAVERQQQELANEMQRMTKELATSAEDIKVGQQAEAKSPSTALFGLHSELKLENYKRTLARIRRRLSAPEKAFSKTIHQRQIDNASALAGQTVARPVGLLVGGLTAFVGSLALLLLARYYGYSYSFAAFLLLFAGGYLVGSLAEFGYRLLRRRRAV